MPPLFSEAASEREDINQHESKAFAHTGFFPWRLDVNDRGQAHWVDALNVLFFPLSLTTTQLYLAAKMHTHSILETSFLASVAKNSLR